MSESVAVLFITTSQGTFLYNNNLKAKSTLPWLPAVPAAAEKKSLIQKVEDPLAQGDYRPPQEGDQPDFWEGAGWDGVGFVLQYLLAFGIAIAVRGRGGAGQGWEKRGAYGGRRA